MSEAADGSPVIPTKATALPLPYTYSDPPDATQPGSSLTIRTGYGDPALARNPRRGNAFSLWTAQTVANGYTSAVRWLEINPAGPP